MALLFFFSSSVPELVVLLADSRRQKRREVRVEEGALSLPTCAQHTCPLSDKSAQGVLMNFNEFSPKFSKSRRSTTDLRQSANSK